MAALWMRVLVTMIGFSTLLVGCLPFEDSSEYGFPEDLAELSDGLGYCPEGELACAGECIDPMIDARFCGGCHQACPEGAVCNEGLCECLGEAQMCEDGCFDWQSSAAHCGSCEVACLTGEECYDGACRRRCVGDEVRCEPEGPCVTLDSEKYCGSCDVHCGYGELCSASAECEPICDEEQLLCGEQCYDYLEDEDHCGACDIVCSSGQECLVGSCQEPCQSDLTRCGQVCVDLESDNSHCGSCDVACDLNGGQYCDGGQCLACEGWLCDDICLPIDELNCSGCGYVCTEEEQCSDSSCQPTCAVGLTLCEEQCVNLNENALHCGACSQACDNNKSCLGGACSCTSEQMECGGICVDTQSDPNHCGGCSAPCQEGGLCVDGSCQMECADGEEEVDGVCTLNCDSNTPPVPGTCSCDSEGNSVVCAEGFSCFDDECLLNCDGDNAPDSGCYCVGTVPQDCVGPEICIDGVCGLDCNETGSHEDGCYCDGVNTIECEEPKECHFFTCQLHCSSGWSADGCYCDSNGSAVKCTGEKSCQGGACVLECGSISTDEELACSCVDGEIVYCAEEGEVCFDGECLIDCDNNGQPDMELPCMGDCDLGVCDPTEVCTPQGCAFDCDGDGFLDFPQPCGGCGEPTCGVGEMCSASACICRPGLSRCGGECVDTDSNPNHCGSCGNMCSVGEICCEDGCEDSLSLESESCAACAGLCYPGACVDDFCVESTGFEPIDSWGWTCLLAPQSDVETGSEIHALYCHTPEGGFDYVDSDLLQMSAGHDYSCFTDSSGVQCVDSSGMVSSPTASAMLIELIAAGPIALASGNDINCVASLTRLQCWGLGFEDSLNLTLELSAGAHIIDLSCGATACCALVNESGSHRLRCLGELNETTLQLEDPLELDSPVSSYQEVSVGVDHLCAREAGRVHCFGSNAAGQLNGDPSSTVEEHVYYSSDIASDMGQLLATGEGYSCVVTNTSAGLTCWGRSVLWEGSLPQRVLNTDGTIESLVGGPAHLCFVHSNPNGERALYCAGKNDAGQIDSSGEDPIPLLAPRQIWPNFQP